MNMFSFAFGIGTRDSQQNWLEVFYPNPVLQPSPALIAKVSAVCGYEAGNTFIEFDSGMLDTLLETCTSEEQELAGLAASLKVARGPVIATFIEVDTQPASVPEVYLKLHLLSHRLALPNTLNLEGMFAILPNVAWTSIGAVAVNEVQQKQLEQRLKGDHLDVMSVDKFPKMTDYVVPAGVRIADTARVRLGAYIGDGTTIMHEGFVNFNAGSAGQAMIEGRISAGVMVGNGSDLGGGASILGTLSGGGKVVVSVGEDSLIGANAGIGFPLGDRCIIEAGLYVTAGTKVTVLDQDENAVETVKARDMSGKNDLLFRRNSVTGSVECKTNKTSVELNSELHSHN